MKTDEPQAIWEGVFTCSLHPSEHDDDCDGCEDEMASRTAVIDQMQAEGTTRAHGLAKQGVQMPDSVIASIRMELLIDTIFHDDKQRVLFEGECGRRVIETLKMAQEQANRQALVPDKRLTVVNNVAAPHGRGLL